MSNNKQMTYMKGAQRYENRIYRMWKYGTSNDHWNFDTESRKSTGIDRIQSTKMRLLFQISQKKEAEEVGKNLEL